MSKTTTKYHIEKVCRTVRWLYKSSPSLAPSDKIVEIDKTIEIIKEAKTSVPLSKSKWFPDLLDCLEKAKNDTCACEELIQHAFGITISIAKENNIPLQAYLIET